MEPAGKHQTIMTPSESSITEYFKFGLVILAILFGALLCTWWQGGGLLSFLRWIMGLFFILFSIFKLASYRMFTVMFAGYDVLARRIKFYAYAYPFIELVLGILYAVNVWPIGRDVVTMAITGLGSIGVLQEIRKRSGIHCACLGNIIKLPLSTVSLVEDVGMGLMALFMLLAG